MHDCRAQRTHECGPRLTCTSRTPSQYCDAVTNTASTTHVAKERSHARFATGMCDTSLRAGTMPLDQGGE